MSWREYIYHRGAKFVFSFFFLFFPFFIIFCGTFAFFPTFPFHFESLPCSPNWFNTPSLLDKWHTYPRDCKLAEVDCRVFEISNLAYLVITFYSENSNKKKEVVLLRVLANLSFGGIKVFSKMHVCRISLINSSPRAVKIDYKQVLINCFWLYSLDF